MEGSCAGRSTKETAGSEADRGKHTEWRTNRGLFRACSGGYTCTGGNVLFCIVYVKGVDIVKKRYYAAYGSNLNVSQMSYRSPSCTERESSKIIRCSSKGIPKAPLLPSHRRTAHPFRPRYGKFSRAMKEASTVTKDTRRTISKRMFPCGSMTVKRSTRWCTS